MFTTRDFDAETVLCDFRVLVVNLKGGSVYDHCYAALHALMIWDTWKPVTSFRTAEIEPPTCSLDILCHFFPPRILEAASYLYDIPSFFEEFDIISPNLSLFKHDWNPNSYLRMKPCVNCNCDSHSVEVVSRRPIRALDQVTILHAPQDMLRGIRATPKPCRLDVPPGQVQNCDKAYLVSTSMLQISASLMTYTWKTYAKEDREVNTGQLLFHLLSHEENITVVVEEHGKCETLVRNHGYGRAERLQLKMLSELEQCNTLYSLALWDFVKELKVAFQKRGKKKASIQKICLEFVTKHNKKFAS